MSFFDDASLAFLPSGAAGKDGKAYSIKPVPVYGSEEITNGDFSNGYVGWGLSGNPSNYSIEVVDHDGKTNALHFTTTSVNEGVNQNTLQGSKLYKVKFDLKVISGSVYVGSSSSKVTGGNLSPSTWTTYQVDWTSADSYFRFYSASAAEFYIDNVSVQEIVSSGDFTFSRGSNLAATRVGEDGLIEKGRENLLKNSNNFNTTGTAWNPTSAYTLTSGQSGYDGSNDAWLLNKTTTANDYFQQRSIVGMSGNVIAISIYAKDNNIGGLTIFNANGFAQFKLTGSGSVISHTGIDAKIEPVSGASGWFRCSLSVGGGSAYDRLMFKPTAENAADTSGSIYIQNSQLEIGLAATDVIESGASTGKAGLLEDEPRFDYSGGASCPSLLLEPSRTNLIGQSEYFDSWTKVGSPTITNNYGISPEGLQNSTRLETTSDRITYDLVTINANETFSIYMKGSGTLRMQVGDDNFYPSVTSDWVRYEFKTTQAGNRNLQIRGNGSAVDVELYGAQYERNSYPTSYIPNHSGGSVTRGADTCSKTNASSLNGQTEGTIFAEFTPSSDVNTEVFQLLATTSIQNVVTIACGAGKIYGVVYTNSSYVANFIISQTIPNNTFKVALCYKNNDITFFINGQKVASNTNAYSGQADFTKILFNDQFLFGKQSVSYKKTLIFKSKLSDADCITLTT